MCSCHQIQNQLILFLQWYIFSVWHLIWFYVVYVIVILYFLPDVSNLIHLQWLSFLDQLFSSFENTVSRLQTKVPYFHLLQHHHHHILLLLCTLILYYGLQQWWRGHSVFSSLTASQSDSFTYHIVTMELIYSFGCILICFANYNQDLNILLVGALMYCIFPTGLERLHILTCVKHYLAVGHPITYLGLRNERGIRMRNIFSDCAWLLSMFGTGLSMKEDIFFILYFCFLNIISIITISFCSLCVLCILIRPGRIGTGTGLTSQSRGHSTLLWSCWLFWYWGLPELWFGKCSIIQREIFVWLWNVFFLRVHFASSLVLRLLFLHRTGKLTSCSNKTATKN